MAERAGVHPRHFLAGGMCREEACSAFLATLIEQSPEFQKRFFALAGIEPFEITEVAVEQQLRDVTITGVQTFVVIENKIAVSSKTDGQLAGYYQQLKQDSDDAVVHCIYLAPSRQTGETEVNQLQPAAGETATALAWSDLQTCCYNLPDFDRTFSEAGYEFVLQAIARRSQRASRDYTRDEASLRDVLAEIHQKLAEQMPHRCFEKYGVQLWSYAAITVVLSLEPADETATLDRSATTVDYSFNLASKSRPGRQKAQRWITSIRQQGEWLGFQVDAAGKWLSLRETVNEPHRDLVNTLATSFRQIIDKIDTEVAASS